MDVRWVWEFAKPSLHLATTAKCQDHLQRIRDKSYCNESIENHPRSYTTARTAPAGWRIWDNVDSVLYPIGCRIYETILASVRVPFGGGKKRMAAVLIWSGIQCLLSPILARKISVYLARRTPSGYTAEEMSCLMQETTLLLLLVALSPPFFLFLLWHP
jgi:hypothetical protein